MKLDIEEIRAHCYGRFTDALFLNAHTDHLGRLVVNMTFEGDVPRWAKPSLFSAEAAHRALSARLGFTAPHFYVERVLSDDGQVELKFYNPFKVPHSWGREDC